MDKLIDKIENGKKQEKKVITVAASDKDLMLGSVTRSRPVVYRPIAQIKRIATCFRVFAFIIGGNYKLININIQIYN